MLEIICGIKSIVYIERKHERERQTYKQFARYHFNGVKYHFLTRKQSTERCFEVLESGKRLNVTRSAARWKIVTLKRNYYRIEINVQIKHAELRYRQRYDGYIEK